MRSQWLMLSDHPNFRRLFTGNSVSLLGSSVTTVALPFTAVVVLGASSMQMGLLGAAALLPHLLLGLPAGVWVERWPFRRVLVISDVASAAALVAVPVLAALGWLHIWQLWLVVTITGCCSLFGSVASQAFTPQLVPAKDLLGANSAFALNNSVVQTSGNALAGLLVQVLTAPIAIIIDACTFLISAWCKATITEPGYPRKTVARNTMSASIWVGLRAVWEHPALRATTIAATGGALAGQVQGVVFMLYLVRELHLPSGWIGVVIASSGVAGIVGATVGVPLTRRWGSGPTFIVGMILSSLGGLVVAVAGGPWWLTVIVVLVGQLLRGWGPALYGINQQTIRQVLIPAELLARTQATWRFLVHGVQPIGALLGGVLGAWIGLRLTLTVGSVLMLLAAAFALFSPLRRLRELPIED